MEQHDRAPGIDQAQEVRDGEELDSERLAEFLTARLGPAEHAPLIRQFRKGHSNLTYLVEWAGRALVLRRPPVGAKIRTAHDMGREYRILEALRPIYPKVPCPVAYCEDPEVLGAPFYLMERVPGVILRGTHPQEAQGLTPTDLRQLSTALVDTLVELHTLPLEGEALASLGRPEGYVERQVRGWTERYQNAKTDEIPEMEAVAAWLAAHRPREIDGALIHNDYKYDNLVLDPNDLTRIIAVLDWEMATVGDPLMDLGTTLGYWIDPDDPEELKLLPLGPTLLPGNLSRGEIVERYAARLGRELPPMLFYYVYALFKIAVIAQQIYQRYAKGLTQDPRFAPLIFAVGILARHAQRALERDRI